MKPTIILAIVVAVSVLVWAAQVGESSLWLARADDEGAA